MNTTKNKTRVAVVGATGYTGSELVRLLSFHPNVELIAITSESRSGEPFSSVHPALLGIEDRPLISIRDLSELQLDLVFLALPHRVSMTFVKDHGLDHFRIIDLSGDFRLSSTDTYEHWYGAQHVAPLALQEAAFGLPELFRESIRSARLVANPGCYPTSAILALAPLLREGLVFPQGIVVDSKSGVTGAGAKAKPGTHFPNVFGNFNAYGLVSHRHTPEMEQALSSQINETVSLLFTPHLLPIDRGILTTTYSRPTGPVDDGALEQIYQKAYEDEPFVRVRSRPPAVKEVRGSNYCDIHAVVDPRTGWVITVSVIDNLIKGAAGQAVQNLNIMFGWPETAGLDFGPVCP